MAPKFGNYLFRNLKSAGSPEKASADPTGTGPVEDQEIVLRPLDFTTEIGGALNWGSRESREIRVKLGQTDGLMEGRVTISARMLRDLYPGLVPEQLKEETTFPLSLRSVVLQLQNVMRSFNDGAALAGAPDFDTPIAQVAREDEGFFQLEGHASTSAANRPAHSPTDDLGSVLPLIREKEEVRDNPPPIPPVQVVAPSPSEKALPSKEIVESRSVPAIPALLRKIPSLICLNRNCRRLGRRLSQPHLQPRKRRSRLSHSRRLLNRNAVADLNSYKSYSSPMIF